MIAFLLAKKSGSSFAGSSASAHQLHGDPGEAIELDQARSQVLSNDLLHLQDEFEQVSLRGSARDKLKILHHSTHCDVGPLDLKFDGFLCGFWWGSNDDGLGLM